MSVRSAAVAESQHPRSATSVVTLSAAVSDLSIDAMDVAGEQQLDVEHNLFKQRLDKNLQPVSTEAEKHGEYPERSVKPTS